MLLVLVEEEAPSTLDALLHVIFNHTDLLLRNVSSLRLYSYARVNLLNGLLMIQELSKCFFWSLVLNINDLVRFDTFQPKLGLLLGSDRIL